MKTLRFLAVFALCLLPLGVSAQQQDTPETKLRDALRNSTLQLRKAQSDTAALQVTQAEAENERDTLKKQLDALTKQSDKDRAKAEKELGDLSAKTTALEANNAKLIAELSKTREAFQQAADVAKTKELARSNLEIRVAELERIVADRERKNVALVKVGQEILNRLERFGLGDAIKAKEPFIGAKRVQIQALVQDYNDKILDQKYQPGTPAAAPAASATPKPEPKTQAAKAQSSPTPSTH
ncbi:MAG: phage major capsid protein [Chthoniobacteraceae bacterium]